MHVLSLRKLREFWTQYPAAKGPLSTWYKNAKAADWETFADVRETYASADQIGRFTVFNIGGNKFRLVVVIHFNRGKVYVRHVLTHAEYSEGKWREERAPKGTNDHGKDPPRRPPQR